MSCPVLLRSRAGLPIVVTRPESEQARAYMDIAAGVAERLESQRAGGARKPPRIVVS